MTDKTINIPAAVNSKICPIGQMPEYARRYQEKGKTVVLAHGVFDLIHLGHIRHLEAAKRHGDILLVTITADKFVNKGPDRPVYSGNIRAEMLAAIEIVDQVAINPAVSLADALLDIRPDIYIKGSDYQNFAHDVTGNIKRERQAVEAHGGQMLFTDEIVFSSSAIINKNTDIYDVELKEFLDGCRENGLDKRLPELIESVRDYKVLVVGDSIVDEYRYVEALGRSAKEYMISTKLLGQEIFAGGVFAVANQVANFCENVEIVTSLGDSESYENLIRQKLKPNVSLHHLVRSGKPTTRKTRYIESGYFRKMFEVYNFDDTPLGSDDEQAFNRLIEEKLDYFDLVIVSDFGHGLISRSSVDLLRGGAKFLAVNAQTNSANIGFNLITKYHNADYICIDAPETRLAIADNFSEVNDTIIDRLQQMTGCDKIIVTHGKNGCFTFEKGSSTATIPAFTKTIVDTVGAGDAFLAVTSPLVAAGGNLMDIGFIGNAVGALNVGIVGHRSSVEKPNLLKYISSILK